MPSGLHKVTKKLNKKKRDISSLHAASRDAKRLRYAAGRDEKILKHASMRSKMNEPYLDRIRHFQNALVSEPERKALSFEQLQELIKEYITIYEPELEDIQAARRPGRPPSAREEALKSRIESERKEYDVGYWVPDMLDEENVQRLVRWDGDWSMLSPIKFIRVDSSDGRKESRWPPNGQSNTRQYRQNVNQHFMISNSFNPKTRTGAVAFVHLNNSFESNRGFFRLSVMASPRDSCMKWPSKQWLYTAPTVQLVQTKHSCKRGTLNTNVSTSNAATAGLSLHGPPGVSQ